MKTDRTRNGQLLFPRGRLMMRFPSGQLFFTMQVNNTDIHRGVHIPSDDTTVSISQSMNDAQSMLSIDTIGKAQLTDDTDTNIEKPMDKLIKMTLNAIQTKGITREHLIECLKRDAGSVDEDETDPSLTHISAPDLIHKMDVPKVVDTVLNAFSNKPDFSSMFAHATHELYDAEIANYDEANSYIAQGMSSIIGHSIGMRNITDAMLSVGCSYPKSKDKINSMLRLLPKALHTKTANVIMLGSLRIGGEHHTELIKGHYDNC